MKSMIALLAVTTGASAQFTYGVQPYQQAYQPYGVSTGVSTNSQYLNSQYLSTGPGLQATNSYLNSQALDTDVQSNNLNSRYSGVRGNSVNYFTTQGSNLNYLNTQANYLNPNVNYLNTYQNSMYQPNYGYQNTYQPNYGYQNTYQPNYGYQNTYQPNYGYQNMYQPNYGFQNMYQQPVVPQPSVLQAIADDTDMSSLKALISDNYQIQNLLNGPGPFTIFAPSNAAIAANSDALSDLSMAGESDVLAYHILRSAVSTQDLRSPVTPTETLYGADVVVTTPQYGSEDVKVNTAEVTQANIICANGVIHIINDVLTPPQAMVTHIMDSATDLSTLADLLNMPQHYQLTSQLAQTGTTKTLFAPTDDAFASVSSDIDLDNFQLVNSILAYHVVTGTAAYSATLGSAQQVQTLQGEPLIVVSSSSGVEVNDAEVVSADIIVADGVIHTIDKVLVPQSILQAIANPWTNNNFYGQQQSFNNQYYQPQYMQQQYQQASYNPYFGR